MNRLNLFLLTLVMTASSACGQARITYRNVYPSTATGTADFGSKVTIKGGGLNLNGGTLGFQNGSWLFNPPLPEPEAVGGGVWGSIIGTIANQTDLNNVLLNKAPLVDGMVPRANLGTGTADSTTYLRGDGTWAAPSVGIGGSGTNGTITKWTGAGTLGDALVGDFPTLNQNTTGTAANVTGTVAIANGGTGATTAALARAALSAAGLGANTFTATQQTNGTEITVANKNKHMAILSDAGGIFLRHQTQYWNGSAFAATEGWGLGTYAFQNNTGNNSNGFGNYALQNNTGDNSNGFGSSALFSNTGNNSNGFGYAALSKNTGFYSNGFGYTALQNNTGSTSNGFGYAALSKNTGTASNGFGYYALQNNNWNYALAIGHQAGAAFTANAATAKTFTTADITANTITFGSAHGFPGSDGSKINLLFTTTAGTPPTGLVSGTVYQFTRTSSTVMTFSGIGTNASGDFAGKLENSIDTSNTIVIGNGANATKANQVMLGPASITETVLRGNVIAPSLMITTGAGAGKVLTSDASGNATWATPAGGTSYTTMNVALDGGGSAIQPGQIIKIEIGTTSTITEARVLADTSGNLTVNVYQTPYASWTGDPATGGTLLGTLTMTGAVKMSDAVLSGWTKALTAGNILSFVVDGTPTVSNATIALKVLK